MINSRIFPVYIGELCCFIDDEATTNAKELVRRDEVSLAINLLKGRESHSIWMLRQEFTVVKKEMLVRVEINRVIAINL